MPSSPHGADGMCVRLLILVILGGLDGMTERLTETHRDGADGLCCTRSEDGTACTCADSRNGGKGSSSDEDGADDAHGLRVFACDVVEGVHRVEEPHGCVGDCCDIAGIMGSFHRMVVLRRRIR